MKRKIYNIYGFLNTFKYPTILKACLNNEIKDNKFHLRLAGDWLLFMQNKDGGYSRKFSFVSGRDKSYIETTGYIIPSMINLSEYLDDKKYVNSALKAGKWLLDIQNDDGSFSEIDNNKPYAFDTGQCVIGLNFLYEYTNENKYLEASKKAVYWLIQNQENDGSWQKVAYNNQKHTYYSRVASAMYKYGVLANDDKAKNSAIKNIEFVLSSQKENGFFEYSSFLDTVSPYLHTLIYILEGLLDIYELNKDDDILQAVLKNADKFKQINLNKDVILCSQYDKNFNCVNDEKCITGLAQWAGVSLRLYVITKDEDYKKCTINTIFYLKSKQLKSSFMKGGFSASIPFWGRYGSFDFVNWSNKFFIDSLIEYDKLEKGIK